MVVLLDCQKEAPDYYTKEDLKLFGVALLCSLLDIMEDDISPNEMRDIAEFCKGWVR